MGETRQLAWLVGITLGLGILGLVLVTLAPPLFEGNLVVGQYDAALYENGTLTETYTYDVKSSGDYRMLYRTWEAPLTLTGSTFPGVEFVALQAPQGTTGYLSTYSGVVTIPGTTGTTAARNAIASLAERNEAGIFDPSYFDAGTYTVTYTWVLHPPVEYDTYHSHLNLKLAGTSHIPYRSVRVTVPSQSIDAVYAYPPSLSVTEGSGRYTITGSVGAGENLAVEMLAGSKGFAGMPAFRTAVDDVKGKTESAAFWYNVPYYGALLVSFIAKAAVILVPLSFILIYRRYGREKEFGVPAYLSTLPGTGLKPWQVNLLFKDDALEFDRDGYYATLLDLHRKKLIEIIETDKGAGIEIRLRATSSGDPYEQRVLNLISSVSEGGVFDSTRIEALAQEARKSTSAEEKALRYQKMVKDVTERADPQLPVQYIVDGREHIVPLLLGAIVLFAVSVLLAFVMPAQLMLLGPAVGLSAVVLVQTILALMAPSTLFGHWKDDHYREKLEWEAFAHFLSDLAMVKKYSPADLSMWGEWLVFGTAMGVGDRVEQAMKALNISIPEAGVPVGVSGINHAFVPIMYFSPPSHGSSGGGGFGGGGFAGGGGFGGGGAGGR